MGSRSTHSVLERTRVVIASLAVAMLGGLTVACVPPTDPEPQLPPDIDLMTDEQAAAGLADVAPEVVSAYAAPEVREGIPREALPTVDRVVDQMRTADGRAALVAELRELSPVTKHGLTQRPEHIDLGSLGLSAGDDTTPTTDDPVTGVRTPPPFGPGTTNSDGVPVGANAVTGPESAAPCRAPHGTGAVSAPASVRAGQFLTPQRDVFTRTSPGILLGQPGPLSVAGVEPVPGQGPGIELRNVRAAQQMRVRIHLEDPKAFGPAALYPLINIRPIGGDSASEYRATVTDARIHCYAGDTVQTGGSRGYFEGWVTIPRAEPGFQVIAEVVENDWYFRCTLDNLERCDLALSDSRPRYWAGADRATVHAGEEPLTDAEALPAAVGAFATGVVDPRGDHNVLTDTNNEMSDDLEAPIRLLLDSTIRSKVSSALAGELVDYVVVVVQARLREPIETSIDLRFTTPHDGFTVPDEPIGHTGALHADVTAGVQAALDAHLLGLECDNITANVDVGMRANVWADSAGNSTGITPRLEHDVTSDVDLDMAYVQWFNPICIITRGIAYLIAEDKVTSKVTDGLEAAFVEDEDGNPGAVRELLEGFDLNTYLPTIDLTTFLPTSVGVQSPSIRPVVTDLDNSWCHATTAPPGCTGDQDLFGRDGLGVVADATMVSSLGQALGGGFEGRFRNVFAPSTSSSVADLTTTHRNAAAQLTGLGVVLDPRLLNTTLRHLAQGRSLDRTTNGLLDVPGLNLPAPGWRVSTRPEVAPMVLGVPDPGPVVCPDPCTPSPYPDPPSQPTVAIAVPDLRAHLTVGDNSGAPVEFSVGVTVGAGAGYDPSTEKLDPVLSPPQLDLQVVGGCKADYRNGYALAYTVCGRGNAGAGANSTTGAPISLTDLVAFVVNEHVSPLVDTAIGGIELPSLDGIVPGLNVSFTNVQLSQRGGFVTAYADLRPTPRFAIQPSTAGSGVDQVVRFFPSQVFGIDLTQPTSYTWEIRDAVTGQLVPTAAVPFVTPPNAARQVPISAFAETTGNFGTEKRATARLTISQPTLHVTAEVTFTWYPPSPPPNNPCAGGPGGALRLDSAAAAPGC